MEATELTEFKEKLEIKLYKYLKKYKIFGYINYAPDLKNWKDYEITELEFETTKKTMHFGKFKSDFINQFLNKLISQLKLYTARKSPIPINSREDLFTKIIKPQLSNGINYDKIILDSTKFLDLEYNGKIKYDCNIPKLFNFQKIDIIPIEYNNQKDSTIVIYDSSLITLNIFGDRKPELEIISYGDKICVKLYFLIDVYEQYVLRSNDIDSIIKLNLSVD